MILVDYREKPGRHDQEQLVTLINRIGVKAEKSDLVYGDIAFEGRGPEGAIAVGIERKRISDMLNCIDDARYNGHQRIGMKKMYRVSFLLLEAVWKPHDPNGTLMESQNGGGFFESKYRNNRVVYSKLRRYLFSVALAGIPVLYTRDMFQTAYDICECYHYFQKPWHTHTSLLEMQKLNIPTLNDKPSVTRQWAAALTGLGLKHSEDAERLFKTPIALATSEPMEWLSIPGIGMKTVDSIMREIEGKR